MKMMKALVKARPEKGLWMQEVQVPEPGLNDVIIKVKKSAICGTDLHIYEWDAWSQKTIHTPMIIGHEYMGYIEKMGAGVTNLKIGERVTGEGHLACGHCRNCRRGKEHVCENTVGIGVHIDGSFAEYVKVPATNVIPLDHRIPDEWAAIMDPFGNATHTALSFPLDRGGCTYHRIGAYRKHGSCDSKICRRQIYSSKRPERCPSGNRKENGGYAYCKSFKRGKNL